MTDRFAPKSGPLSIEDAMALLHQRVAPLSGIEDVALAQALGRVLAGDVVSEAAVPPHDNSAMDGWGFAQAARPADGVMPVVGTVAAGHPLGRAVLPGSAVRILTGAPTPEGVDTVAMQEDCTTADGKVTVPDLKAGANVRFRGEDISEGTVILRAGIRLRPQELGLAAAAGQTTLPVCRRVRVALFSTGDEIIEPGRPLPPGCIYDTNRTTAGGLLRTLGCDVTDLGILPDKLDMIAGTLADAARNHDLILTSGGVSVGDADHVKTAVENHGSLHFWKLPIKPGGPIALGEIGKAVFIGLPGNPVAVMVTFMLVARPLIMRLMGAEDYAVQRYPVVAGFTCKHRAGRREWLRGRVRLEDGKLVAEKFHSEGSGMLSSMVWSDGLVEVPETQGEVAPGDPLLYIPYAEVAR